MSLLTGNCTDESIPSWEGFVDPLGLDRNGSFSTSNTFRMGFSVRI